MIAARAFAKVNLALAVSPPEPPSSARPGWHRIASWFSCVGLFDDVVLHAGVERTRLDVCWADDAVGTSPIDWPMEKDLCVRAAAALEARAGRPLPTRIAVHKRIPVGGGLGGGSSDAAATLMGMNRLHGLGLPGQVLREVAKGLGSDVAFFIDDEADPASPARPALVEGFGDRMTRVGAVGSWIVLMFPPFGCPTPAVYGAFDAQGPGPMRDAQVRELIARSGSEGRVDTHGLFNDLAGPAEAVAPGLAPIRQQISRATGQVVHVTGSGSTLFVLAGDEAGARRVAAEAARARADVAMAVTRLV